MITSEELAASLLRRLARAVGHSPDLENVDLVPCEDDEHVMAYFDLADGRVVPIVFPRPPLFDATETAVLLMTGCTHVTVH